MTIRTSPHPDPFAGIDCYQPVVGGLRHLTNFPEKPADGTEVVFLCGLRFVVGTRQRAYEFSTCSTCRRTHEEGPRFWENE
jgi:hypothetical protein